MEELDKNEVVEDLDDDFLDATLEDDLENLLEDFEEEQVNISEPVVNRHPNTSFGRYLNDIEQFDRISPEQEIELSKLVQAGLMAKAELTDDNKTELLPIIQAGDKAREDFINANYRLVIAIAKKYQGAITPALTMMDLIQSGNLGLMTAVERYDYTKGWKFSTYATYWIKQALRRDLANTAQTIRIPVHVHDWLSRIHGLEVRYGDLATPEFLAETIELPLWKIEKLLRIRAEMGIIYLDRKLPVSEEDTPLMDLISSPVLSPEQVELESTLQKYLMTILNKLLTDRELYIITRRYGLLDNKPRTLESISHEFGLTRERIRQIEANAMRKLKRNIVQKELRDIIYLSH